MMKHVFVTQDFGPDRGGMARRYVELCRRFDNFEHSMAVSAVDLEGAAEFDRVEPYPVHRQPFHFRQANRFINGVKWARWLTDYCRGSVDVIHCGNIRPSGYPVAWTAARLGLPYILYVNGGDLLREKQKAAASPLKRRTARRILGGAAGIAGISTWVGELAGEVMRQVGVVRHPPVATIDLGTNPEFFSPEKDSGRLRAKWGLTNEPVVLTVARLVPHKGQDNALRALALLASEFPELRYVMVGEGHDEPRLRALAAELSVADRVVFAGALPDDDLPEVYATSTIYLGPSRMDKEINVEGFGISFIEASASGIPVVAGDSGGVRSAVRDGETGLVVNATDVGAIADSIAGFLRDDERRRSFGEAGRRAVETHYNWDRVARETREFVVSVTGGTSP